jgi:hypothetical protein
MLCFVCQSLDLEALAILVIQDESKSASINYHDTVLGIFIAIQEGCELCLLLWDSWLVNSQDWRWGDLVWDDEEEHFLIEQSTAFKFSILSSCWAYKPVLRFDVLRIRNVSDFDFEYKYPRISHGRSDDSLFRRVVRGVVFRIDGEYTDPTPRENSITLEIQVNTGDNLIYR